MKSNEEMTRNVIERGEKCIRRSQRQKAVLIKSASVLSVICITVLFGFSIHNSRPTESEIYESPDSGIQYNSDVTAVPAQTSVSERETVLQTETETTISTTVTKDSAIRTDDHIQQTESQDVHAEIYTDIAVSATTAVDKGTAAGTSAVTTSVTTVSKTSTTAAPDFSGSCGGNAYYEYDEFTRTLHIMGSSTYSDPIDLDSLSHLYDKVNVLVLDKGIEALGYRSDADHLVVKIMQYAEHLTVYHYNGLRDQAWMKLYCNNYFDNSVTFINVELDSVSGVSCGDDLWFDYDMDTRSLYIHGTGDTMDETKLDYLVGYFDKVYIDKSIVSLNHISANHIFVANTFSVSPTQIYHYSEYKDVSVLKREAGDNIEFINLDENPLP